MGGGHGSGRSLTNLTPHMAAMSPFRVSRFVWAVLTLVPGLLGIAAEETALAPLAAVPKESEALVLKIGVNDIY